MSTIRWEDSFITGEDAFERFESRQGGVGPKDQAKARLGTGNLPSYFMTASSYPDSPKKYYMINRIEPWIQQYCDKSVREEYEILTDLFPLKLFFDLEFVPQYNPNVSMEACIAILHQNIVQCLKLANFVFHDLVRLDANIHNKTSTHLVYPKVVFKSMAHMQHFIFNILVPTLPMGVFEVLKDNGDRDHVIDLSVYSKDRLFRLYGSQKGHKQNPLLPPGASPTDPLDVRLLLESLVSVPMHLNNLIQYDLQPVAPMYDYVGTVSDWTHKVCYEMVKLHSPGIPGIRAQPCPTRGRLINVHLVPGVVCSIANYRQHKSNTTYFSVDPNSGRGWYQCTDPECRASRTRGKFGEGFFPQCMYK